MGKEDICKEEKGISEKKTREREGQTGIETEMERDRKNTVSAVGLGLNILPKRKLAIYLGYGDIKNCFYSSLKSP